MRLRLALLVAVCCPTLVAQPREPIERFALRKIEDLARTQGIGIRATGLDWNLFILSATLHNVTVFSLDTPDLPPIAYIDEVTVNFSYSDLFAGSYTLQNASVVNPLLHVVVAADGRNNIPKLPERKEPRERVKFLIEKLSADNVAFQYEDLKRQAALSLPKFGLQVTGDPQTRYQEIRINTVSPGFVMYEGRTLGLENVQTDAIYKTQALEVVSAKVVTPDSQVLVTGNVLNLSPPEQPDRPRNQASGPPALDLKYDTEIQIDSVAAFLGLAGQFAGRVRSAGTVKGPVDKPVITARLHGEEVAVAGFQNLTLDATALYDLPANRIRIDSYRVNSPLGSAEGGANIALTRRAGRTTVRARVRDLSLPALTKRFDAPVSIASRATGTANVWWPGLDAKNLEGDASLILSATRSSPAKDALPVSGEVRATIRGNHLVAHLTPAHTLDARLEGTIELRSWRNLDGRLNVRTDGVGGTLAGLARFLGRDNLVNTRLEGPVTASVDLGGTVKSPVIAARLDSPGLTVGELRDMTVSADVRYANEQIDIRRAETHWRQQAATVQGTVSLRGQRALNLTANIANGDLNAVIAGLGQTVPVFGSFTADAKIGGTLSSPVVTAVANGNNLRAFDLLLGTFSARARLENGTLFIDQLQTKQPSGGELSASATYVLDTRAYTLNAQGSTMRVDGLMVAGEPVSGFATFHAEGSGTVDNPQLSARLDLTQLAVGPRPIGEASATVDLNGKLAQVRAEVPLYNLTVAGTIGANKPYPAQLQVSLNGTNLESLPVNLPRLLTGTVTATADVTGDLANIEAVHVVSRIETANVRWGEVPVSLTAPAAVEYANQRLVLPQPVTLRAGESTLTIGGTLPLQANAAPGSITIDGNIDLRSAVSFVPSPQKVEATGTLQVQGVISGTLQTIDPRITATLANGTIALPDLGIPPFYNVNLALSVENGVAVLQRASADWGPAIVQAAATVPLGLLPPNLPFKIAGGQQGQASFQVEANNVQMLAFGRLPEDLSGVASVHVDGTASKLTIEGINAKATFSELSAKYRGFELAQANPATVLLFNGVVQIEPLQIKGPQTNLNLAGSVSLAGNAQKLDVRLTGETNAGILSFFVDDIKASGPMQLQVVAAGSLQSPNLSGFVELNRGLIALDNPRLAAENLRFRAELNGSQINITQLRGTLNGGRLTGDGYVNLARGGISDMKVSLQGNGVYLEFPQGLRTSSNFNVSLIGYGSAYVLDGAVKILEGSYTRDVYIEEAVLRGLRGGQHIDLSKERNPFLNELRFNVRVDSAEPLLVDNNLAKAEVTVNLLLVGTYYRPGLTGRISIEEGGEVYLAERKYIIDRGIITLTNEQRIEPQFDILARAQVGGYEISLSLTGDLRKTDVTLTADDPALTEPEILALLLTGRRVEEAKTATVQVAREQILSLLAGSVTGRVSREFQQAIGLSSVRIEPSLIAPEQNPTARLTVGQDLTRNLSLIYSMDLADAGNQIWIAEYDISRRFTTRGIKQEDNTYRFEFRHDVRFGGTPFETIDRGPDERKAGTVRFIGNRYFTDKQLQDAFKVKPGDRYDFFKVRNGVDRLQELYAKAGLLEARISLRRNREGNIVNLNVRIQPGPKVEFVYEGWDLPGDVRDTIRKHWQSGVFDEQRIQDAEHEIRTALFKRKYLKNSITTTVDAPNGEMKRVLFEIQPGTRFDTVNLTFDGAEQIKPDDLRKVLEDAKLEEAVYVHPREVSDLLTRYYHDHGFLTGKMSEPKLQFATASRTANIVIPIKEGPRYRIGEINFTGNTAYADEELRAQMQLEPGEYYDPDVLEQAYIQLQDLYWKKGYNDVDISYTFRPREEESLVDLTYNITENKQRVVQSIMVKGQDYTSERLIRSQLSIDVGDVLTSDKLSESRRNLYSTGAYRLVEIQTINIPEAGSGLPPNQRPVAIEVRVSEIRPYQIRYGGFYDTDRGPGAISDFTTYNTLGSARSLGLRTRYDSQLKEARLYFSQPLLRRFPLRTTAVGFGQRERRGALTTDRIGFTIQEEARWGDHSVLSFGYRFEQDTTRDLTDPVFPFDVSVRQAPFSATYTLETRDDLLSPTTGSFLSQAFEYSPSWAGSEVRFARSYTQFYHYEPIGGPVKVPFTSLKRVRLLYAGAISVGLAGGLGGQELIPSERFFAGGGTTIRGFEQDHVGPQVAGVPIGGDAVLIINNELRFPIWKYFDGVTFVDIGNVYPTWRDFSITDVRKSAGLGLRVRTPYFMLRLDYGIKLDRKPGESLGKFFFSIGQMF